jgi:CBS domain-containing protein
VHRLVVVEGDRAVGVLSAPDILAEGVSRNIKDPIRSIVSQPVETIDLGESIQAAVTRLADANVHGLVVVDRGAPVGVFTHREAIAARRLAPMLRGQPVEHAMSYQVVCLDIDTPISRAVSYGTSMSVRRFLATEDGRPAGIVSCIDLVDVLARAPEATGAA